MAHRDEDTQEQAQPDGIVVRLVDVEPFMGLSAAVARFFEHLNADAYKALTPEATEALSEVQGIMWRLHHSNVEKVI